MIHQIPVQARQVREEPPRILPSAALLIRRAEHSFAALDLALRAPNLPDIASFHAHEGVERILKALIVAMCSPPPPSSDLQVILSHCPPELREHESVIEACARLVALWPRARDLNSVPPSTAEATQAALDAHCIRELAVLVLRRLG